MAWSSRKNFQLILGYRKKREQKEKYVDNLLPLLYLLRLVDASPETVGSRKKDRKGKRPYDRVSVRVRTLVSVQGVESLWGGCRFIPKIAGHSSRFVLFCSL